MIFTPDFDIFTFCYFCSKNLYIWHDTIDMIIVCVHGTPKNMGDVKMEGHKENELKNKLARYNSLTPQEQQELLKTLKSDISKHEAVIKEKQEIINYLNKDVKEGRTQVHVIVGVYSGVVQDVEVFIDDEKANEYEKELCKEYGVPFNQEGRAQYYSSDGEHEIKHFITTVRE